MKPIFFNPDYKERVWGGKKMATVLNKSIPFEQTGESWEIACHQKGQSTIRFGEYEGLSMEELLLQKGESILGEAFKRGDKFPLLIKFIDAKEKLSVQVHPDDAYAKRHEKDEYGKSEAWYVIQADSGSKLIVGLKPGVTREVFEKKIETNQLEEVLNEVEVSAGDVLDIPAGLIHAIGDGILLVEVQQNSDKTYRVYDWGRRGLDGLPRELHVQSSLEVSDFDEKHSTKLAKPSVKNYKGYVLKEFVRNPYFVLEELTIMEKMESINRGLYFEIYLCIEGELDIEDKDIKLPINKGDVFMIPADLQHYNIKGSGKLIRTYVEKM
jgi:mannose-6-phosphate isomerase